MAPGQDHRPFHPAGDLAPAEETREGIRGAVRGQGIKGALVRRGRPHPGLQLGGLNGLTR